MKFSDIIKSTDSFEEATVKIPAPSQPRSLPPSPPQPQVAKPAQDDASMIAERVRREAQAQFEKELQAKLEAAQNEARRFQEELIKSEEEKSFARAESLKKEKRQLLEQLEELKIENREFRAAQQSLEELKKQMALSQEQLAESFQKKLADLDAQVKSRPSDSSESLEEERKKIEKQVREELDAATRDKINELERRLKESERKAQAAQQAVPAPVSPQPAVTPAVTYTAPEKAAKPVSVPIPLHHPDVAREAIAFYEKLVHVGRGVFDQRLKEQELDLGQLTRMISELARLSAPLQDELIGIVVEPYPEEDYFVYHAANIGILCVLLGMPLKLDVKSLEELGMAGFLHDISLLTVKAGLSYPKQLSSGMQEELKKHPERSAEIIGPYVPDLVKTAVLQHHELSNGKGYPSGLLNDAIHLYAKIINIADSFEAMVHVRPYRPKPYEVSEAVKEMIEKERGLYDRDVVKALLGRVGLYPIKSYVELSNKQVARVLRQNTLFPISPVIQVEFDEDGNKIQPPMVIDLSQNQLLHITGPLKTGQSYTKEKISVGKENPASQNAFFMLLKEIAPLLIIAMILGLFVYLVVKV